MKMLEQSENTPKQHFVLLFNLLIIIRNQAIPITIAIVIDTQHSPYHVIQQSIGRAIRTKSQASCANIFNNRPRGVITANSYDNCNRAKRTTETTN